LARDSARGAEPRKRLNLSGDVESWSERFPNDSGEASQASHLPHNENRVVWGTQSKQKAGPFGSAQGRLFAALRMTTMKVGWRCTRDASALKGLSMTPSFGRVAHASPVLAQVPRLAWDFGARLRGRASAST